MSNLDIIRAWKDEQYRDSLSAEERELLPENPAGAIELTDEEMEQAQGGSISLTSNCSTSLILCDFTYALCVVTFKGCK
ncbi:MAG TPA: mersacidin/lichenicidin family type 2 lantibiotic [Ktedonobacteraceae bacterium]|nr:mersacidin/lichenicidin family type 2 lantibiotic [Ktedonobacteraceae bacterium]